MPPKKPKPAPANGTRKRPLPGIKHKLPSTQLRGGFSDTDDSPSDDSDSQNAQAPLRSSQTLLGAHNTLKQLLLEPLAVTKGSAPVAQTPKRRPGRPRKVQAVSTPTDPASTPLSRLKSALAKLEAQRGAKRTSLHFDDVEGDSPGSAISRGSTKAGKRAKNELKKSGNTRSTNTKAANAKSSKAKPANAKSRTKSATTDGKSNGKLQEPLASPEITDDYVEQVSHHLLDLTDDSVVPRKRRSSYNNRGKRVSSIGNGYLARPHSEVSPREFYKLLDLSMPEPDRMRQLLSWCFRRSLDNAAPSSSDTAESETAHGVAKVIKQELLEDLQAGRISTSWYSIDADDSHVVTSKRIVRPNPQNEANRESIEVFRQKLEQLQRERVQWLDAYEALIKDIDSLAIKALGTSAQELKAKGGSCLTLDALLAENLLEKMEAAQARVAEDACASLEENVDNLRHLLHKMRQGLGLLERYNAECVKPEVGQLVGNFMTLGEQTKDLKRVSARDLLRGISRIEGRPA